MRLTPIDIKKQEFKPNRFGGKGFDTEEVQAFLDTVSKQWESLLADNAALKAKASGAEDEARRRIAVAEEDIKRRITAVEEESKRRVAASEAEVRRRVEGVEHASERRIAELESDLAKSRQVEEMMRQTIRQFQESTAGAIENAKREADLIRKEAQLKAAQLIEQAKNEVVSIGDDIHRLMMQKHEIVAKLKLLLQSQLEILTSFDADSDTFLMNHIAARKKLRIEETVENLEKSVTEKFNAPLIDPVPSAPETTPQEVTKDFPSLPVPTEPNGESKPDLKSAAVQDGAVQVAAPDKALQPAAQKASEQKASERNAEPEPPEPPEPLDAPQKLTLDDFEVAPVAEKPDAPKEKTVRIEVPLEPPVDTYRSTTPSKKTLNIDDILSGIE